MRAVRQCYKTPYYLKNLFLLGLLAICLVVIDYIYFKNENGSVKIAMKIMRGLSSSTFNYLEQNKKQLEAEDDVLVFGKDSGLHMSTLHFNHACLSLSKICKFEGIALEWPIHNESDDANRGTYFKEVFGESEVHVYRNKNAKTP